MENLFRLFHSACERLERAARSASHDQGLSQKEAALELRVDPRTLALWEQQGGREPTGVFLGRVKRFLQEEEVSDARRAG
ncbi:MAG: hypothetical protein ABSC08_07550 [Bryobacteraceae bacterium]